MAFPRKKKGFPFIDGANVTGRASSGSSPDGPGEPTGSNLDNASADPKSARMAQGRKAARQSIAAAITENADNFTKDIQARTRQIQKGSGRKRRK